jgi:hypothetical protein
MTTMRQVSASANNADPIIVLENDVPRTIGSGCDRKYMTLHCRARNTGMFQRFNAKGMITSHGLRLHGRGQSVVELALAAPLLFLMLFGIIDFGRAYYQYLALLQGTREGARFAASGFVLNSSAQPAPQGTIQGRVQLGAGGLTVPNDGQHIVVQYYDTHCAGGCATTPKLCAHWDWMAGALAWDAPYSAPPAGTQSCPYEGDAVKVTTRFDFRATTPLIGAILGPLRLTAVAHTRIE